MQGKVNKEAWIDMFRQIGLDDDAMMKWHRVFETRHPDGHADFLAWLGISPEEITKMRARSR
jgi:hypothetical protein